MNLAALLWGLSGSFKALAEEYSCDRIQASTSNWRLSITVGLAVGVIVTQGQLFGIQGGKKGSYRRERGRCTLPLGVHRTVPRADRGR